MNSSVRIAVRATFGDAQKQFAALIAELNRLDVSARAAGEGVGSLDRRLESSGVAIGAWGKKLQYASSILTYNFTVPIVAAFGLLVNSELKYEKALASLEQVYKRTGSSVSDFRQNAKNTQADLASLSGIVLTLSSNYGVARAEVVRMATELGRAGSAGVSLAKDTQTALIAQRAYNLTGDEATAVVTTLRASYHLLSDEARNALGVLAVSNESTRGSFDLLAQGLVRAAPVASQLGVPIRNLVALLSTMNQAGFKGGESGNALSAGLQRLVVITPKAADLLKRLGIDAQGAAFQSLNGAQRIQLLADKLKGANGDLTAYAASVIFGVQRSKQFDAVIADLSKTHGSYNSILRDTQDTQKTTGFLMQQLGIQLKNPAVALDVLKQQFLNNASVIARDLLPALAGIMVFLTRMSGAFAHLSPPVQQFLVFGLVMLALLGPIGKLVGSFGILIGFAKTAAEKILGFFGMTTASAAAKAAEQLAIEEEEQIARIAILTQGNEIALAQTAAFNASYEALVVAQQTAVLSGNEALGAELLAQVALARTAAVEMAQTAAIAEAEIMAVSAPIMAEGGAALFAGFLPVLGIIAVLGVILTAAYAFHDQFLRAFENIAEGLGYIVASIYALLQWINPFARHSPSLVENVDGGTARINQAYSRMAKSASADMGIVAKAQKDLNAVLGNMGLGGGLSFSIKKGEKAVEKQGISDNVKAYHEGEAAIIALNRQLAANTSASNAQALKVLAAKTAYDSANKSVKDAQNALKDLEAQQKALTAASKGYGDPTALRSQATAASNMGRALLSAGNPALAAQFGAQAQKLAMQADQAQKSKDKMESLTAQIDAQRDAIANLTEARDALLNTYNDEKDSLSAIKSQYSDIKSQITDITSALQQMAQSATSANNAAAAAASAGKGGKDKNPGFGGALGSTLAAGKGGLLNDAGSLKTYLDKLKADLGNQVGSMFPNPLKPLGDFMGKLKTAFKKGLDDFSKGAFDQAFGFGKDLPTWIQKGLTAGIAVLGTVLAYQVGRLLLYALSGKWIAAGLAYGRQFIFAIVTGAEGAGLATQFGLLARRMVVSFGRGILAIPGLIATMAEQAAYALVAAAPEFAAGAAEALGGVLLAFAALPVEVIAALAIGLVAILAALIHWRTPIWNFAKKIPGWIWDAITSTWDEVLDLVGLVTDWISKTAPGVGKAILDFGSKIPGWLWKGFVQTFEDAFFLVGFIIAFLVTAAVLLVIELGKFGAKLAVGIWHGLVAAWNLTVDLAGFIGNFFTKTLPSVGKHLVQFGKDLPDYIWNGLTTAWSGAVDLSGYIGKFLTKTLPAAGRHLLQFGKDLPGYIGSGIESAWNGAVDLATIIAHTAVRVAKTVGSDLLRLGKSIVTGIASGIADAAGGIFDALKSGITSGINSAYKFIKGGSPSKLFAERIGTPIGQGIGMGIQSQTLANGNLMISHISDVMDKAQAQMNARSKRLALPRLTQNIDLKYVGQPLTNVPGGSQSINGAGVGRTGVGAAQQVINVNMHSMGEGSDPHAVAAALAWKLRMSGAA